MVHYVTCFGYFRCCLNFLCVSIISCSKKTAEWPLVGHSLFTILIVICLFIILVISQFGFDGEVFVRMVQVIAHLLLVVYNDISSFSLP